jgi:hypothetical protein
LVYLSDLIFLLILFRILHVYDVIIQVLLGALNDIIEVTLVVRWCVFVEISLVVTGVDQKIEFLESVSSNVVIFELVKNVWSNFLGDALPKLLIELMPIEMVRTHVHFEIDRFQIWIQDLTRALLSLYFNLLL